MKGYNFRQPCIECGALSRLGNRCELHQKAKFVREDAPKAERKKKTQQYSGNYRKRAKAVRDNAVICHICKEGYRPYDPWQADHLIPGNPISPLAAAHRSCNASRGNKPLF
jgi:hypothetical protein